MKTVMSLSFLKVIETLGYQPATEAEISSNNCTRGPEHQVLQDTSISESLDHIDEEAEINDDSSNFNLTDNNCVQGSNIIQ